MYLVLSSVTQSAMMCSSDLGLVYGVVGIRGFLIGLKEVLVSAQEVMTCDPSEGEFEG